MPAIMFGKSMIFNMKKRILATVTVFWLTVALSVSASAAAQETWNANLNNAPRAMAEEKPYLTQCELGSVVADAFCDAGNSQIALVESRLLSNDLNQGKVKRSDVQHVFAEVESLARASITPKQLYELLEHAVSKTEVDPSTEHIAEDSSLNDDFCQISGFTFRYDASAPAGSRVVWIRLNDGAELERDDVETKISVTAEESLLKDFGSESIGMNCVDAVCDYLALHDDLPEGEQERIAIIGVRENMIIGMFPRWLLIVGVGILAILLATSSMRLKLHQENE